MGKSSSTLEEEIENWGENIVLQCYGVCVKEQTMKRKLRRMKMMEKQPLRGEKRIACDEEEWRGKRE